MTELLASWQARLRPWTAWLDWPSALLIGLPLRSHWSFTLTPEGRQVPGFAARVEPTTAFPFTVGLPLTSTPGATAAVGRLVVVAVASAVPSAADCAAPVTLDQVSRAVSPARLVSERPAA